jgi:ABC-type amino acid transport system permease subunit
MQPHQATSAFVERASGGTSARLLTIDQCVENVLPVLLHQVVDVTEDTAVDVVVSLRSRASQGGGDLPHGDETKVGCGI